MTADDTREDVSDLRESVISVMPWYDESNPDYTDLDAVLRAALAAARRDPDVCSGCGVEDNFSKDTFGERCMSCGTAHRDPEAVDAEGFTEYERGWRDSKRAAEAARPDPEPVASADAAWRRALSRMAVGDPEWPVWEVERLVEAAIRGTESV